MKAETAVPQDAEGVKQELSIGPSAVTAEEGAEDPRITSVAVETEVVRAAASTPAGGSVKGVDGYSMPEM